jgi:xanthine dehydrogenase YagR molybdenum-binding subunit
VENFRYAKAADLASALTALRSPSARALAGGTELLNWMRDGIEAPARVVDISGLPLNTVQAIEKGLSIGALARMSDVAADPAVRRGYPVLVQSLDAAGQASGRTMHGYGAVFVEVAVDPDLGLVRMRRCVAGYSAGRIINPKTARSQMTGGIVWGYAQALLEESAMDPAFGRYLSKNLAGVMVPVNLDIPEIDVFFVEENDPQASLIGARGIGELGAVGVAPAIANAVYHATGTRIRDLPIRIERVLGA